MPTREIDWLLREKYHGRLTPAAEKDIVRLKRGEHVAYVIGFADFLGVKANLAARPLIPRPETEYWTEKIITEMPDKPLRVLDIFCGSGCIGLAVLKHRPEARADFADIETGYFAGIKKSARSNKISVRRLRTIHSDVFKNIRTKYDYILANPPYIPRSGRRVQKSVLKNEPHRALFGGADGLKFIRALLKNAPQHLKPGGELVFEFDPPQKNAISALRRRLRHKVSFFRDQYGRWRYGILKT